MADGRSRAGNLGTGRRLAAATLAVAVMSVCGCAVIPGGGPVTTTTIAPKGARPGLFVQMVAPGPQPGWEPGVIVSGFLLASASFTGDHATAREYLTPAAAKSWHPESVAEYADTPTVAPAVVEGNTVTVGLAGQLLGTISEDGQYQAAEAGVSAPTWNFTVERVAGQWRISSPPPVLLLSKRDITRTFMSRDLYFFDQSLSVLVPDPVYVPSEASATDLVTRLVDALRQGPQGWLAVGAKTAFPPGTTLLGASVTGSTATVNLGGRAAATGAQERDQMATQLLQTLASPSSTAQPDTASIQAVVFEINGKAIRVSCATGEPPARQFSLCGGGVPDVPGSRAYYVDSKGRVATLGPRPTASVPGPAGTGAVRFDRIAISPDEMSLAGVSGRSLYTAGLTQNGSMSVQLTGVSIRALSWDSSGGLWAAGSASGQQRVWRLDRGVRPVQVVLPAHLGPVTALRVAPDGVRVAIVTGDGATSHLWLAAINRDGSQVIIGSPVPIGTDLTNFTGLTWYDSGDVIVLTVPQPPSSGAVLYEVPVDGGQSRTISTASGTVAIAASQAGPLVAALADNTLMQLPDPGGTIWGTAGVGVFPLLGRSPVYPG